MRKHTLAKWGMVLLAMLFPLLLVAAEEALCHPGNDQCPVCFCHALLLTTGPQLILSFAEIPYSSAPLEIATRIFPTSIFHPPQA
ncbi:MAG: hypothetical protein FJ134_04500 [Deltaproteobacteria bacterium]|nr:hypothetical protein [Deltaproteobacteria bacterium]